MSWLGLVAQVLEPGFSGSLKEQRLSGLPHFGRLLGVLLEQSGGLADFDHVAVGSRI